MSMTRVMIFATLLYSATGCFSWFGGDDGANVVDEAMVESPDTGNDGLPISQKGDELELKIAKLWSRVSELEEQVFRQKEKIRVLEKGLMLGLVPEEMKQEEPYRPEPVRAPDPAPPPPKKAPAEPPSPLSPEEQKEYQDSLGKAHDLYRSGRYGVAIKAFSEIHDKFGAKLSDGVSKYWIAKCWVHLKEFSIAHQTLVDFTKEFPSSAFLPRARLEMARIQVQQGLRETAIENFRMIIDQYPYEDAAEMARMELQRLENTL